jgi:hypothetical protein
VVSQVDKLGSLEHEQDRAGATRSQFLLKRRADNAGLADVVCVGCGILWAVYATIFWQARGKGRANTDAAWMITSCTWAGSEEASLETAVTETAAELWTKPINWQLAPRAHMPHVAGVNAVGRSGQQRPAGEAINCAHGKECRVQ